MRPQGSLILISLLTLFGLSTSAYSDDSRVPRHERGKVVVADRASGTITVINVRDDTVFGTFALPAGAHAPEPMYVVHTPSADLVLVGDRANSRVVAFDDKDFSVQGYAPTGNGVFHMWADSDDEKLWVNNDIDNTATVIDPGSLEVLATVPMPQDLVSLGGKPHDVILDPAGDAAYVTLAGFAGDSDYVVKFDTESFTETARAAVGKDPHVSLTRRNRLLYVPCQNSDAVFVLKRRDLSVVKIISVPGAHGAGMPSDGKTFYTTNLPGGGIDGLYAIDTKRNKVIGEAVDTPFPVPHNIAITRKHTKLYVTHSGASAQQVSVYTINRKSVLPRFKTVVTTGFNPFGLAFVP